MSKRPLSSVLHYIKQVAAEDLSAQSDRDLLERFRTRRDEAAFAALVKRHGPLVMEICRRMLHHVQDAEDAFQATFLVLAKKSDSIRRHDSVASWLYKVAYRLALRLRSHNARQRATEANEDSAWTAAGPSDDPRWSELRTILDEELAKLPERYRAPLVLCYLLGKTRDEAAEELGWTTGTVKGQLERARKMLRRRLQCRGIALSTALMSILLAPRTGAAVVPLRLLGATLEGALSISWEAAPAGVSSQVLQLVEYGMLATGATWLKPVVLVPLLTGLIGLGTVLMVTVAASRKPDGPGVPPPHDKQLVRAAEVPPVLRPRQPAFVDITRESGLETVLADQYAAQPKWWLSGQHLVDLNGDGHLDLFMSAHSQGGAIATLNDGKGHFQRARGTYPPSEIHLAYDLDEDGKLDLSMTHLDGGSKWWLNRSESNELRFEPTKILRDTNTGRRQALIDINRDGRADWIRGVPNVITFDLADGKGSFTLGAGKLPVGNTLRAEVLCIPVDLDGDGHIDLLVEWGSYGNPKGTSRIYRNDGKMNFQDITEASGLNGTNLAIKGVADVNQDGAPDLLVMDNMQPRIYLNDGKGKFTLKPEAITGMEQATKPSMASWGLAVMTDFDNDGVPDLIWNGKHFLWLLRGTGGGNFRYMNREWGIKDLSASSVDDGLCFGDIDSDGRLDIVGYTANGNRRTFAVYRNNLPLRNWLRVRPIGTAGNKGAAGAKVRVYAPGTRDLLWYEQIAIFDSQSAPSYYAHAETERHYGIGDRSAVDVEVEFYPSGKIVRVGDVKANTTIKVSEGKP